MVNGTSTTTAGMSGLCRDCAKLAVPGTHGRCSACGGRRIIRHGEIASLSIAHMDCDAFYASVEKRDDPGLLDRPVIVGGGRRGVVAACCYLARLYGVRSAMPMFKALSACPHAVVVRPDMAKYQAVGRTIRELMFTVTPLVEPIALDEAFMDLGGTEGVNGGSPAATLARLAMRIEQEVGITVSIGLSYNKFLAKVASDLDKPRGFSVVGRADAAAFLARQPVGLIWGVGPSLRRRLAGDGVHMIGDLLPIGEREMAARYGAMGRRLYHFARGEDERKVMPHEDPKSVSAETTFDGDITGADELVRRLWPLCETVARRLKAKDLAAGGVALKLKTVDFRTITRSRRLLDPTQIAEVLLLAARPLVEKAADGTPYRLIGVGADDLVEGKAADPPDLFDERRERRAAVDRAMDDLRARLGPEAIRFGRGLAQ
jgi:DNA polymerase IV